MSLRFLRRISTYPTVFCGAEYDANVILMIRQLNVGQNVEKMVIFSKKSVIFSKKARKNPFFRFFNFLRKKRIAASCSAPQKTVG
jgi:hypothetical protein